MAVSELDAIKEQIKSFVAARDWSKFHSPKNLYMALSVECSELLECFQWLTEDQSNNLSPEKKQAVADEIADVQIYLIQLADKLNIDLCGAVNNKLSKNASKYPVDLVKGSAKKYTEY